MPPRLPRAWVLAVLFASRAAAAQAAMPAPGPPAPDVPTPAPVAPVAPIVPHPDASDRGEVTAGDPQGDTIDLGVLGVLRIDGKGRGFAGGAGLAISRGELALELMLLKSDEIGGYLGLRYRPWTGLVRPYGAVGVPGFVFDHAEPAADGPAMTTRRVAVGVRAAAGIELAIHGHMSVQADLGYEHFFFLDAHFEADVFVPTLGVIGWL